jgi:hypothetical protein
MNEFDPYDFLRDLNKNVIIEENSELGSFFESAMKTAVKGVKKEIEDNNELYKKLETEQESLSEKYKETGVPDQNDIILLEDLGESSMHTGWLYENLTSIYEMRIVNLFRSLEIDLKYKLESAYKDVDTKQFYRWDILISFFETKNMTPKTLNGYQESDQLRRVNNQIKHGGGINNNIKNIQEFTLLSHFDSDSLEKFLSRVYKPVNIFFTEITKKIYADLYQFDDNRLDKLALSYKDRMDGDTISRLIEKLK